MILPKCSIRSPSNAKIVALTGRDGPTETVKIDAPSLKSGTTVSVKTEATAAAAERTAAAMIPAEILIAPTHPTAKHGKITKIASVSTSAQLLKDIKMVSVLVTALIAAVAQFNVTTDLHVEDGKCMMVANA